MASFGLRKLVALAALVGLFGATWDAKAASQPYAVSEFAVKTGPRIQSNPRIDGKWAIWQDSSLNQDATLAGRNMETGLDFTLTPGSALVSPAHLGNDTVVAAEMSFDQATRTPLYGIFGYHVPDGKRFTIAEPKGPSGSNPLYRSNPRSDGETVIWLESEGERHDIYGYDLAARRAITVSTVSGEKEWLAVSSNIVTWRDKRNVNSSALEADIYLYDLSARSELRLTEAAEAVTQPAVSSGRVVWFATISGMSSLVVYDVDTHSRHVAHSFTGQALSGPEIDGNLVVWSAAGDRDVDIFGFDLAQGKEFVISRAVGEQSRPSVSGATVLWEDYRNSGVGKYEYDGDIYGATLAPGPADVPPAIGVPEAVDAKIEIVWPQGGVPVADADRANIGTWLFLAGSGELAACQWYPRVELWKALNNEPARLEAVGQKEGGHYFVNGRAVPTWEFNNVDVRAARDPDDKLYFYVAVPGVTTGYNVWSHAIDARTYFPRQDVPTGVGQLAGAVDARIEIVWPHDNAPVDQAEQVNIGATLFISGTNLSLPPDWSGNVRLYRSINNDIGVEIAVGQKRIIVAEESTYPVWDFNNIDVSAATDPANKYYFTLRVDGLKTHSNVWAHGADGRTIFPRTDTPSGDCRPNSS